MGATSGMTAGPKHPSWCFRPDCTAGNGASGWHWSRPMMATDDATGQEAAVCLSQATAMPGYPYSGMTFVETLLHQPGWGPEHPAIEIPLCFPGKFACRVGRMLITLGRSANQ